MRTTVVIAIIACWLIGGQTFAQTLTKSEVEEMMNRAFELSEAKRYEEALDIFLLVGKNTELQRTESERKDYIRSQTGACLCYELTEQYEKGYQLAKKLIAGNLKEDERKDVYRQYVLNGYLMACRLMRKSDDGVVDYNKARELLFEIMPYADDKLIIYVVPKVPYCWYAEGVEYYVSLKFNEALDRFKNALTWYHELGLVKDEMSMLKLIASGNNYLDMVGEAIGNYEQALELAKKIQDVTEQLDIAKELYSLYNVVGNMEEKNHYNHMMDSLFDKTNDKEAHFTYYNHKGEEAQGQRLYKLAEQWFFKSKSIAERLDADGMDASKFIAYANLRDLYSVAERHNEALEYGLLALKVCPKETNSTIRDYYLSVISVINTYSNMGDMDNCYKYLDSLFVIEPYLDEPRERSKIYTTRGGCLFQFGDYEAALADYKQADAILASKYPETDVERIGLYPLIGGVEHKLNHYSESEHCYRLYADMIKEIYGERSLKYINAQIYLANAQGFAGNIENGCDNYTLAVTKMKNLIKERMPYMNTAEREGFWGPLSLLLTTMTPYALEAKLYQTEYTQTCYDALLTSKAFLLSTERSLYDIVKREGDETDLKTYMHISSINNKIKEWERNYAQNVDSILNASKEIAHLEEGLMKRCNIGDITSFMDVDYQMVKGVLKDNEYLVDFTDFVSETQGRRYAAYVIDREHSYPLLKSLFAERQIDSMGIGHPALFYDEEVFAPEIIKLLWNPIKEHFVEGATIYYVPSQMLFQVCLESLPLEDGTLLGDHYNFVRLSSARELVKKHSKEKSEETSAVLYGGLYYDLEPEVMVENAKQYEHSSLIAMRGGVSDDARGDSIFRELPGSKMEVERISTILKNSRFDVTPYMGIEGTEESFLNLHGKSPRILHLATHGFYYTPTEAEEVDYLKGYNDAMSLSGLIMSGGNAAWRGNKLPEGVLGGVLTANDIVRVDLSETDMVVLSACQSGQGNATDEGLYGLQRAFKKAGVGTIVMTLWSVSDKVATEFMIKFYEALAENDWDKHKAFEQAKSLIRKEYPNPYHWAAFVMLD